jgi:hypothetical protein
MKYLLTFAIWLIGGALVVVAQPNVEAHPDASWRFVMAALVYVLGVLALGVYGLLRWLGPYNRHL